MANSRFELHMRLDNCGRILSTFLSDEISETMLGLPSFARDHLDKFRSFLQMYHIAKHGYYPPQGPDDTSASFPKHVYDEMRHEFQMLYNFLADTRYALNDSSYAPQVAQSGVGLLPALKAFDARREYRPLPFALPLLPEGVAIESPTSRRRNIWFPSRSHAPMSAKMVTVQALAQATNCQHPTLLECSLVRAYRNFEKQSVLEGADKQGKLTHVDARKLRWLLIYGILQVLLEATQVPEEVRGLPDVPYHLGHVGRGPLPWEEVLDARESIQTQVVQARKDWVRSRAEECIESPIIPSFLALHVKSDLNQQISPRAKKLHSPPVSPAKSEHMERSHTLLGSSTVKKAMNALENLPVLRHAASHKQLGRSISASDNTIPLPHVDHLDIITRPATASGRAPDRSLTIAAMVDPHHTGRRSPDSERTCAGSVDRDDSTADWSLTSTMEDAVVSPATSTTCSVSPCPSMQSRSSKRSTPRRSIEDSSTRGHASSSDYAHVLAPDEVIIVKGAEPQYGQSSQHRSGPDIQTRYNEGTTLQDSEGTLRPTRLRPRPQHLNLTEAKKPFAASSGLMSPKSPLRTPRTPKTPLEITAELTGAMKQVEAAFAKGVAEFAQQHNVEMPSTPVVCPSADALSAMHSTPSSPSTTRAAAITPPVVTISAS